MLAGFCCSAGEKHSRVEVLACAATRDRLVQECKEVFSVGLSDCFHRLPVVYLERSSLQYEIVFPIKKSGVLKDSVVTRKSIISKTVTDITRKTRAPITKHNDRKVIIIVMNTPQNVLDAAAVERRRRRTEASDSWRAPTSIARC